MLSDPNQDLEQAIREAAYYMWENEGRPEDRADDHWKRAAAAIMGTAKSGELEEDEEKILAGRPDANMPALLTKDVKGG